MWPLSAAVLSIARSKAWIADDHVMICNFPLPSNVCLYWCAFAHLGEQIPIETIKTSRPSQVYLVDEDIYFFSLFKIKITCTAPGNAQRPISGSAQTVYKVSILTSTLLPIISPNLQKPAELNWHHFLISATFKGSLVFLPRTSLNPYTLGTIPLWPAPPPALSLSWMSGPRQHLKQSQVCTRRTEDLLDSPSPRCLPSCAKKYGPWHSPRGNCT